jgi:beta-galactosidase
VRFDDPRLWAEHPHLYDLVVEVRDADGRLTEVVPQRIGIRRFAIEDGVLRLNGDRVVFNGINRHEFGLNGRSRRELTESDIRMLKAHNVNAVRTSHYPNDSAFYALADEYGLMVIDEMNLETHARWSRIRLHGESLDTALPGDHDEWRPAALDRARSMLERDKNHASVVIWSCGNESFGGTVLRDVADWFRSVDDRPVHYEGVHWDPRYPETTDIASQMYTPPRRWRTICAPTATSRSSCAVRARDGQLLRRGRRVSSSRIVTSCSRAASSGTSPIRRS